MASIKSKCISLSVINYRCESANITKPRRSFCLQWFIRQEERELQTGTMKAWMTLAQFSQRIKRLNFGDTVSVW